MKVILLALMLAANLLAATNRTVTVKSSGGDYASLSAAIAGEKGDMVTLDRQLTIECYAMADTTSVTIANADWVTDATRYILVYVPPAERHLGVYDTSKYRLEKANGIALTVASTEFVRIDGLQFYSTGNYATVYLGAADAGSGDIRISNSIIRSTSSMAYKGALMASNQGSTSWRIRVWNCLFYGATNTNGRAVQTDINTTYYFWNNTFAANRTGILRQNGAVILKNNVFTGNTTTGTGAMGAGTDYNRTDLATLNYTVSGGGNTHDAVSQTFSFVNAAGYDWHLASDDAGAKDLGVSDPSSGYFSDDVDGQTRTGSWDVGFDEIVAAVTGRPRLIIVTDQ